ncbi:MAG: PAS domain S-box protein, partial [Bacteroidales bacterium]|nr:PAS domain S-box protein [Bacteroidales bacterium]
MDSIEKLKVLLLEDNQLDMELVKHAVQKNIKYELEFKWVIQENEFVEALTSFRPDIILSDFNLPSYTGLDALKHSIRVDPSIPFIIVTGSMSEEIAADSIKAGAWDYVVKDRLHRLPSAFLNALKLKVEKEKATKAKDELRELKEKTGLQIRLLYKAIENAPSSIVITDNAGSIQYVNPEFERLTGYTPTEAYGQNPRILKSGIQDEAFYKTLWDTISNGSQWSGEIINKKKNGDLYWEQVSISPIQSENNEIQNYIAVKHDISLLKKQEEELLLREKNFSSLLKNPKGYVIYRMEFDLENDTNQVTHVSPSIEDVMGVLKEDWYNMNKWYENVHPDDYPTILEASKKSKYPPYKFDEQFRYVHPTKGVRWLHIRSTGIEMKEGNSKLEFETGIVMDITEQKVLQEELKASEEKYYSLFTEMAEGSYLHEIIYDQSEKAIDYRILDCNPASEILLGIKKEKAISKLATELFRTNTPPFLDIYSKVTETGEPATFEVFFEPMNKHFSISAFSPSPHKFATIFSDITKRIRSEKTQTALYNISNAVLSTSSLEIFLNIVRTQLSKIIDTANFFVALYDKTTDSLSLPFMTDQKDKFESFPAKKTMTGYVIKTKKPLLANIQKKKELEQAGEIEIVGTLSKIWLGVPLFVEDEVIGVLAVQSYENEKAFNDDDLELLSLISHQISISIIRKKEQEDLKVSEEKFRLISSSAQDAIIMIDNNSSIIYWNPSAEKTFGYSSNEVIGRNLHEFLSPAEYRSLHMEKFPQFQKTGEGAAIGKILELAAIKKNGEKIPIELSLSKMEIDGNWGAVGILRDISERKKAEKEIHDSELKLKTILNEIQAGVVIIDEETKEIIDLNPAAEFMIGLPQEKIRGKKCINLICPHDQCEFEYGFVEKRNSEGILRTANGENIPILKTVIRAELNGRKCYIDSFVDISEQKELQSNLKNALSKSQESDHLKSAFLATMSHELRTPLNAVIGFSDLIMDGMDEDSVAEMAQLIHQNGQELLKIIESIFEISMIQSNVTKVEMEDISLVELFASVKQAINASLIKENKSSLHCVYKPDPMLRSRVIKSDRTKLLQILSILVNNVVKFTD